MDDIKLLNPKNECSGIRKSFTFIASHNGKFKDGEHVDNEKHEHDWKVIYRCKSRELNEENVVCDFRFAETIKEQLDGKYLNELDIFKGQIVTTEYIAKWIRQQIPKCYLVEVFETDDNMAWSYKTIDD